MATRPGNGWQAAPSKARGWPWPLVVAILGLVLGVLFPPLFLLGAVAIALGAGHLGRGQERLSPAGRGLTIASLVVGVICLLLTLPFLGGCDRLSRPAGARRNVALCPRHLRGRSGDE